MRELVGDERKRLKGAMREDYLPFFRFAQVTGLRLLECLLRWSEVDWGAGQIRKLGKGGRLVTRPITPTCRQGFKIRLLGAGSVKQSGPCSSARLRLDSCDRANSFDRRF